MQGYKCVSHGTIMRGVEQGGKSPFSLLSETISPSSLLFEPISLSSLNASFSFSPSSLLFPPISPFSQIYLGHFSLLPILFLSPQLCIVVKKIKYVNLPCLFSVVLCSCLIPSCLYEKEPLQLCFIELRKKAVVFLCQNLIMRGFVTILAEIYGDPIFFRIRSGFCQSEPIRSGPGCKRPSTTNCCDHWIISYQEP